MNEPPEDGTRPARRTFGTPPARARDGWPPYMAPLEQATPQRQTSSLPTYIGILVACLLVVAVTLAACIIIVGLAIRVVT